MEGKGGGQRLKEGAKAFFTTDTREILTRDKRTGRDALVRLASGSERPRNTGNRKGNVNPLSMQCEAVYEAVYEAVLKKAENKNAGIQAGGGALKKLYDIAVSGQGQGALSKAASVLKKIPGAKKLVKNHFSNDELASIIVRGIPPDAVRGLVSAYKDDFEKQREILGHVTEGRLYGFDHQKHFTAAVVAMAESDPIKLQAMYLNRKEKDTAICSAMRRVANDRRDGKFGFERAAQKNSSQDREKSPSEKEAAEAMHNFFRKDVELQSGGRLVSKERTEAERLAAFQDTLFNVAAKNADPLDRRAMEEQYNTELEASGLQDNEVKKSCLQAFGALYPAFCDQHPARAEARRASSLGSGMRGS